MASFSYYDIGNYQWTNYKYHTETIILMRQNFNFKEAFKVAIGMSLYHDFYGGCYEFN